MSTLFDVTAIVYVCIRMILYTLEMYNMHV